MLRHSYPRGCAVLYVSLVQSAILMALAIRAARPAPHPVRWRPFLGWGGVVSFVPCWLVFFPATVATFAALTAALAVWPLARRWVRSFLPLAGLAVAVTYAGTVALLVAPESVHYDRLRSLYPLESMEDRVPAPAPAGPGTRPTTDDAELDAAVETEGWRFGRDLALEKLHGDTTWLFINSPGFGVGRFSMVQPTDGWLKPRPRDAAPAQPGPDSPPAASQSVAKSAADMHRAGVVDFVYPAGFGYVRDRHAAGFEPHGFTRVPGPTVRYQVERVELVGLLLHPGPVVYVSDKLPEMTAVRTTPTRPLDDFEAAALANLRAGGDLFEKDDRTPARLLGSLRNGARCVACHGGERGDLLGAFSYTLRVR